MKHAVTSCSFPKFIICGRLFYLFSLQVINTVYKRESAVCSAERSRAHNQKNFQLRSLLEQNFKSSLLERFLETKTGQLMLRGLC